MYSIDAIGRRRHLEANKPKSTRSPLLTVCQVAHGAGWPDLARNLNFRIAGHNPNTPMPNECAESTQPQFPATAIHTAPSVVDASPTFSTTGTYPPG